MSDYQTQRTETDKEYDRRIYGPGHIGAMNKTMEKAMQPAPPNRLENPSCFGAIDHAASEVRDARRRLERIVDRLVGFCAEAAGTDIKEPDPNGLLNAAERTAQDITAEVRSINEALSRLEKHLP